MYYSPSGKLIFLANPRTASSAARRALLKAGWVHTTDFHHGGLTEPHGEGWKVFSTIRNPWDTVVSWMLARRKGRKDWPWDVEALREGIEHPNVTKYTAEALFMHAEVSDVLMRFEDVEEEVRKHLGVELELVNQSQGRDGRHYSEFYAGEEGVGYVKERFGDWGYSFCDSLLPHQLRRRHHETLPLLWNLRAR